MSFEDIRKEYSQNQLNTKTVDADPIQQLNLWVQQALDAACPEATAFCLATCGAELTPDNRVLLLKKVDHGLIFFTNYHSKKGQDLQLNPKAAATFFWPTLERQLRVQGEIEKIDAEASEAYFNSRPQGSQIGAIISDQSQIIASKATLEQAQSDFLQAFEKGVNNIKRPHHWGGYRLIPDAFEFWQGRPNRLHDRVCYQQQATGTDWTIFRKAP